MRPPRTVLLCSEDEDKLSRMSFVLRHARPGVNLSCYAVTPEINPHAALALLHTSERWDFVIIVEPFGLVRKLLGDAKRYDRYVHTLIVSDGTGHERPMDADRVLEPINSEILQWLAVHTQRKRGPKPKPPIPPVCVVGSA